MIVKAKFESLSAHFLHLKISLGLAVLGALLPGVLVAGQPDKVVADFEGPDYGEWQVTGEAFGAGPAAGALPGQMAVEGFLGKGLVNSFHGGDPSTGTLTSPAFKLERKFIQFLIGGGKFAGQTCMNLLVDGKVVRTATGPNDQPGGSERLDWQSWEVEEFLGKPAVIQILDRATGGWGHITVDQITQTDRKRPEAQVDARRDFVIAKRYLHLPIRNGSTKRHVTVFVGGKELEKDEMELADGTADWWAFLDVSAWQGQTLTLQVDRLPGESTALSAIEQSDTIPDAAGLYHEALRGQFHFSSRRGWNNDPNGLVYFGGEYHLFYQHNPFGWDWGNMHWGHAVSGDLVHWREMGDVLAPDALGPMFSGSAVVDRGNTSGLGTAGKDPLVLIYTAAGNPSVQCLAASPDGRVFTKYAGNPVLPQITGGNRDPKVFWHAPTHKWVMVLYVELNKVHTIHFFSSTNLKDWKYLSRVEGFFECPDFFELPVRGGGADAKTRWVLTAASSEYEVGQFDGTTFTPQTGKLPGHRGKGFYAAQTFSDIPAADGRRVQIGWLQTATRGMSFNQSMTIPLELQLMATAQGPRLTWTPVKELVGLRAKTHRLKPLTLAAEGTNPLRGVRAELLELRAEFAPGEAETVFTLRGATIVYDGKKQELSVNGHRTAAALRDGRQRLTIYCDRTALEVFASDGLTYVPMPYNAPAEEREVGVKVTGGAVPFSVLEVHELKSAWGKE